VRDKRLLEILLEWLRADRSETVRMFLADAFGEVGVSDDRVAEVLVALVRGEEHPWVRYEATEALGQLGIGRADVVEALVSRAETDGDPGIRRVAINALGRLKPAQTLVAEALSRLRSDPAVGWHSTVALARMGTPDPRIVEELIEQGLGETGDGDVRVEAALALGEARGERRVLGALLRQMHSDHYAPAAHAAAQALRQIAVRERLRLPRGLPFDPPDPPFDKPAN
jgi:HEAT repeat protein